MTRKSDSSYCCVIENFVLWHNNALRDAHSREEGICRKRPHSAQECAKAHSLSCNSLESQGQTSQASVNFPEFAGVYQFYRISQFFNQGFCLWITGWNQDGAIDV